MQRKILSVMVTVVLLLGTSLLNLAFAAEGQPKVGVVSIARVIDEYEKSASANKDIAQRRRTIQDNLAFLNQTLDELLADFNNLREQQQDEKLGEDAKAVINKQLETKARHIQIQQSLIQRETNNALQDLSTYVTSRRDEIVKEIMDELKAMAESEKYDYVFDTSGATSTNLPTLVYHHNPNDITDKLLKVLNEKAKVSAAEKESKLQESMKKAEEDLKNTQPASEKKPQ